MSTIHRHADGVPEPHTPPPAPRAARRKPSHVWWVGWPVWRVVAGVWGVPGSGVVASGGVRPGVPVPVPVTRRVAGQPSPVGWVEGAGSPGSRPPGRGAGVDLRGVGGWFVFIGGSPPCRWRGWGMSWRGGGPCIAQFRRGWVPGFGGASSCAWWGGVAWGGLRPDRSLAAGSGAGRRWGWPWGPAAWVACGRVCGPGVDLVVTGWVLEVGAPPRRSSVMVGGRRCRCLARFRRAWVADFGGASSCAGPGRVTAPETGRPGSGGRLTGVPYRGSPWVRSAQIRVGRRSGGWWLSG